MKRLLAFRRRFDALVTAWVGRGLRTRGERVGRSRSDALGHNHKGAQAFRVLAAATLTLTCTPIFSAQSPTRISSDAPILNWRLPSFTPEGHRESLVRGSEARLLPDGNLDLTDLTLTLFAGDVTNRVETILLSPSARVLSQERAVTGDRAIRVINDQFEATGTGWRYDHGTKKVSLHTNVRVIFRAELTDVLK